MKKEEKKNNRIAMQKIIYFDEESITDYVQIIEGGKMQKTTELLSKTEETLDGKTKVAGAAGISRVFKAILGLNYYTSVILREILGIDRHILQGKYLNN